MSPATTQAKKNKHLIIAVDDSDSARRAVLYVADLLGGVPGFIATLISIIPEKEMDFFDSEQEKDAWIEQQLVSANAMLEQYRRLLVQSGFPQDAVRVQVCVEARKSLSEAILETRCDASCCTVVVGRGHKTKTEEFLFGSISSRLIHEAQSCAVWVVE
ncbi:MAG TPA: universal stress protein [Nitrospirota bacterium]|nr:universal stress protein [Nitrospirota bacterium]